MVRTYSTVPRHRTHLEYTYTCSVNQIITSEGVADRDTHVSRAYLAKENVRLNLAK